MRTSQLPAQWRMPPALLPPLAALLLFLLTCAHSDASDATNPLLRDIKRFKRTLTAGANAATSYNLATALLSLGNSSQAVPHLLDALADPNFPGRHGTYLPLAIPPTFPAFACSCDAASDALMNAGVCFERMGLARDSARAYFASMRLRPGPIAALNLLTGSRSMNPGPQGTLSAARALAPFLTLTRPLAAACDAARAGISILLAAPPPPYMSPPLDPSAAAILPPVFDFTADALCSCGHTRPCISMLFQ